MMAIRVGVLARQEDGAAGETVARGIQAGYGFAGQCAGTGGEAGILAIRPGARLLAAQVVFVQLRVLGMNSSAIKSA